jgi:hypothetical protein
MIAAWFTAVVVVTATSLLIAGLLVDTRSNTRLAREPPTAEVRFRDYERLLSTFPGVPNADTAIFLLDEAKRHYTALVDAGKAIETKATTLLGLAAGGSSAVLVFGFPKDGKAAVSTPPIFAGLIMALSAFIALLFVLRMKSRREPNVAAFLSAPIALDENNRARIALSLAEDFEAACYDIMWGRRRDRLAMYVAYVCLSAAVVLISANAVLSAPPHV